MIQGNRSTVAAPRQASFQTDLYGPIIDHVPCCLALLCAHYFSLYSTRITRPICLPASPFRNPPFSPTAFAYSIFFIRVSRPATKTRGLQGSGTIRHKETDANALSSQSTQYLRPKLLSSGQPHRNQLERSALPRLEIRSCNDFAHGSRSRLSMCL